MQYKILNKLLYIEFPFTTLLYQFLQQYLEHFPVVGYTERFFIVWLCFSVPSGSPVFFQARVLDSRSVYLEWDPPPADMQNGIIRKYVVTIADVIGKETTIITAETNVIVPGLKPFSTYFCTVAARTIETGPPTAILNIQTPQDGKHCLNHT